MIITNCPRCGSMNATTTCTKCGWSQFTKSTVSTGVLLDDYKRLLLENKNLKELIAELEAAQRWIPMSEPPIITHYNDAVSAGKVSVDVKRELTDAEIEELGAQEAERKEFCPNCEAETPCTHEAELFVCDICGEDFAKYIVLRNCTLPDVSVTKGLEE